MSKQSAANKLKEGNFKVPHTFIIVFFVVLFCAALTYIVPLGVYDVHDVTFVTDKGEEKTRKNVLMPETFRLATDDNGDTMTLKTPLFGTEDFGGKSGLLNYVFEGMVSGDKYGSAVGVVAFILVVGGAFGILLRTGSIDIGLKSVIKMAQGREIILIPLLFILFSLGGAIFGMGEEAIPFVLIIVPLMISLGYDAVTAIMVTNVATQIGFAATWMNPFSVVLAQGVSGIPVLSGMWFRIVMWIFFTALGIVYTTWYANKVKKNPKSSVSYETDDYFRKNQAKQENIDSKMKLGDTLVLLTLFFTMIWIIWGVTQKEYYLPEIATQFFIMGVVAGIIGIVFKLNNMEVDDIAKSFQSGASDLIGAALVVGMAKGIVIVLGGVSASTPTVLNTILNGAGNLIGGFPTAVSAWFMYVFQSIFNFFVVSGSGQAALTMPLMAPLADIVGVTRQVAVLAFQLGDGFTNVIVPTSGVLIACLGIARIPYWTWAKFQIKFQGLLFFFGSVFVILAVIIGYN